ncbi:hypothetical protein L6452_42219 [Arctium lappa]|uniref:Uncharacterized protein n=1 Tax=Arctium lappa TaxID=4217 RepID=A0ACB8XJE0_ARCLA|nr:hypothetical protein L6452_42219 [Arctium lappa]
MLSDSHLPTQFWAEAVNTACFTQNRSLIIKRFGKTAYELFVGRKPSISFLHIFGCQCFILNNRDQLGKFDPKADDGIFLGYSSISKAYRVFNKRRQTVEETIHVTFDETRSANSKPIADNEELNAWMLSHYRETEPSFPNHQHSDPTAADDDPNIIHPTTESTSWVSAEPLNTLLPSNLPSSENLSSESTQQLIADEPQSSSSVNIPIVDPTSELSNNTPAQRWTKDHPIDQILDDPDAMQNQRRLMMPSEIQTGSALCKKLRTKKLKRKPVEVQAALLKEIEEERSKEQEINDKSIEWCKQKMDYRSDLLPITAVTISGRKKKDQFSVTMEITREDGTQKAMYVSKLEGFGFTKWIEFWDALKKSKSTYRGYVEGLLKALINRVTSVLNLPSPIPPNPKKLKRRIGSSSSEDVAIIRNETSIKFSRDALFGPPPDLSVLDLSLPPSGPFQAGQVIDNPYGIFFRDDDEELRFQRVSRFLSVL